MTFYLPQDCDNLSVSCSQLTSFCVEQVPAGYCSVANIPESIDKPKWKALDSQI